MMVNRRYVAGFILGFAAGFFMSYWSHISSFTFVAAMKRIPASNIIESDADSKMNSSQLLRSENVDFKDGHLHGDDTSLADELSRRIRILCLVFTFSRNHLTRATRVNSTWGQRCTKLLFVTNKHVPSLPTLVVNVSDGRQFLSDKTLLAFNYASKYIDDYDWFMKADDDTYVIMENLRYFLSDKDPNEALYFGHIFVMSSKHVYASGGAGYVISREAMTRYRDQSHGVCAFNSSAEDDDFGRCMELLKVPLCESLDSLGRTRFHCFNPVKHLNGNYSRWYQAYDKYKGSKKGISGMSDYAISFHYVSPDEILLLEYSIYHLNPYGVRKDL